MSKDKQSQPIRLQVDREYYFMPVVDNKVGGLLLGDRNTPYWTSNKFTSSVVFINPALPEFSYFDESTKVAVYFILRNELPNSSTFQSEKDNDYPQIYGGFIYNGVGDNRYTLYPYHNETFGTRKAIDTRGMYYILPSTGNPNGFFMANAIDKAEGQSEEDFVQQFQTMYFKKSDNRGQYKNYNFTWVEPEKTVRADYFLLYPVDDSVKKVSEMKFVQDKYPRYIPKNPRSIFTLTSKPENIIEFDSIFDYIGVIVFGLLTLLIIILVLFGGLLLKSNPVFAAANIASKISVPQT